VVADGRESWERGWNGLSATGAIWRPTHAHSTDWPEAPTRPKRRFIIDQLEHLEHRSAEVRVEAARRLAYCAHGTPLYSTSPEEQLQLIISNCTLIKDVGGVQAVFDTIRTASSRWSALSSMTAHDSDAALAQPAATAATLEKHRLDALDEINAELSIYLSIMYFIVEISRGDQAFADDLSPCSWAAIELTRSDARSPAAHLPARPRRRPAREERQGLPGQEGARASLCSSDQGSSCSCSGSRCSRALAAARTSAGSSCSSARSRACLPTDRCRRIVREAHVVSR